MGVCSDLRMIQRALFKVVSACSHRNVLTEQSPVSQGHIEAGAAVGIIAGNGPFPILFAREARSHGHRVVAVCHLDETDPAIENEVDQVVWIRVGELGKLIAAFREASVGYVAMAGGINRVKHLRDVKLDAKGAALLLKIRSTKDDVIMRGIASELEKLEIEVISSTHFLSNCLAREGVLTKSKPSENELEDIGVGILAIKAMSAQDIGQLVVVGGGVVVAVEAVEGTNQCILRGGMLGGKGCVVVKCAKPTQDMRFDVPTVGIKTIETMIEAGARVLAIEAGRTLIIEEQEFLKLANRHKIAVVGCAPLV